MQSPHPIEHKNRRRRVMARRASVAFLALLVLGLAGALAWRISTQPIDLSHVKSIISEHLKPLGSSCQFDADQVELVWGGWKHPLAIKIQSPQLSFDHLTESPVKSFSLKASTAQAAISWLSLLVGRTQLLALQFQSPHIEVSMAPPRPAETSTAEDVEPEKALENALRGLARTLLNPALAEFKWFEAFQGTLQFNAAESYGSESKEPLPPKVVALQRMRIDMARDRSETAMVLTVVEQQHVSKVRMSLSAEIGSLAAVTLDRPHDLEVDFEGVDVREWCERLDVSTQGLDVRAKLSGQILAHLSEDAAEVQWSVIARQGTFAGGPYDAVQKPITLSLLDCRGQGAFGKVFHVQCDLQTPGPHVHAEVEFDSQKRSLQVKAHLEHLAVDDFNAYWPAKLGAKARRWVVLNLSHGMVARAALEMRGRISRDFVIDDVGGFIDFSGMEVDYITGLPHATDVDGRATFGPDRFDIQVFQGQHQDVHVQSGVIQLRDLDLPDSKASVDLDIVGPVQHVLELIDHPPLRYAQAVDLEPRQTLGESKIKLTLNFPLEQGLKLSDVDVVCRASVMNATLHKTAFQRQLVADRGHFSVNIANRRMQVQGRAMLQGAPWDFEAEADFNAQAPWQRRLILSGAMAAKDLMPLWLSAGIRGSIPLRIENTFYDHKPSQHVITSTLQGVAMDVELFGWHKSDHATGHIQIEFASHLGDSVIKSIKGDFSGTRISGSGRFDDQSGMLTKLTLLSQTPRTNTHLSWSSQKGEPNNVPSLRLSGTILDARQFWAEEGTKADIEALRLDIQTQKLILTDEFSLAHTSITAERRRGEWQRVKMRSEDRKPLVGQANTKTATAPRVTLEVDYDRARAEKPLKLNAERAGDIMRLMNWTSLVLGGEMKLEGAYEAEEFRGFCSVRDCFIDSKMPTLGRTLNLISPTGIFEMIGSGGIPVSSFSADLVATPGRVRFKKGRAVSGSLGLTFAGTIDRRTGKLNLRGSLIPAYFINALLGYIPVIGWITGGPGQGLLSASFRVDGTLDDPHVKSNPMSVLTPGFIKTLIERDEEDDARVEAAVANALSKGSVGGATSGAIGGPANVLTSDRKSVPISGSTGGVAQPALAKAKPVPVSSTPTSAKTSQSAKALSKGSVGGATSGAIGGPANVLTSDRKSVLISGSTGGVAPPALAKAKAKPVPVSSTPTSAKTSQSAN